MTFIYGNRRLLSYQIISQRIAFRKKCQFIKNKMESKKLSFVIGLQMRCHISIKYIKNIIKLSGLYHCNNVKYPFQYCKSFLALFAIMIRFTIFNVAQSKSMLTSFIFKLHYVQIMQILSKVQKVSVYRCKMVRKCNMVKLLYHVTSQFSRYCYSSIARMTQHFTKQCRPNFFWHNQLSLI